MSFEKKKKLWDKDSVYLNFKWRQKRRKKKKNTMSQFNYYISWWANEPNSVNKFSNLEVYRIMDERLEWVVILLIIDSHMNSMPVFFGLSPNNYFLLHKTNKWKWFWVAPFNDFENYYDFSYL